MAVARFYTAVDMSDPTITYGYITVATKNQITIDDGYSSGTYYGSFAYDRYGYLIGGTVTGYRAYTGGVLDGELAGGNFPAMTIDYLLENGTALDLYAYVFSGNDTIYGSTGDDILAGFAGHDVIYGGAGNDGLFGDIGNDILDGGVGADVMEGGAGNDIYYIDDIGDDIVEEADGGIDTVRSLITWSLLATPELENLTLLGTSAIDGEGNHQNNIIIGNSADNIILGQGGSDTLYGGAGSDTYIVEVVVSAGKIVLQDIVVEYANQGIDTILLETEEDFDLPSASTIILSATIENLDAQNAGNNNLNLTGNALNNRLVGNGGDNILDGGVGADVLDGGYGDDIYIVDHIGDSITDIGGMDIVRSYAANYTLAADIENLELLGTALNGMGNGLDNRITGNAYNNTLDGGVGADTLLGGLGNDIYLIDAGDTVIENLNAGIDAVKVTFDGYMLEDNIEYLYLMGSAITGTGNALNNMLVGNAENNILDGHAGVDSLYGGLGDDTYRVNLITSTYRGVTSAILQDALYEYNLQGVADTLVLQSATLAITAPTTLALHAYIENMDASGTASTRLNLNGNTWNNIIIGNDADNIINGGLGADTMIGGAGNDTYVFDNLGDMATENSGNGIDTIQIYYTNINKTTPTPIYMTYAAYNHIENITLFGAGLFNVTGNDLDNVIKGNASINHLDGGFGNDVLDGGIGADIMDAGYGDDIFIVDNIGDTISDIDGIDTVRAYINYTLASDFENLELLGTALNGTGNAAVNRITGNAYNNILDGGLGADALIGGAGNDTYLVDDTFDDITEAVNGGIDLVRATATYSLRDHVENLTLMGVDNIDGTGNALNNIIIGNDGNNMLVGAGGNDALYGGKGDDLYAVDLELYRGTLRLSDSVIEYANNGNDTLQISFFDAPLSVVSTLILPNFIESFDASQFAMSQLLNLTGNALNNTIRGNNAANILDGGLGSDDMYGGLGNDVYLFDVATDRAHELNGQGNDTVRILYKNVNLAATLIDMNDGTYNDIENITLVGIGLFNVTGNDLNNTLTGNAYANMLSGGIGNDVLDGGAGVDILNGGTGNDIFIVDNIGDQIVDSDGMDTVRSYVNYTLAPDLEDLELLGAALNGTGNTLDNRITGNAYNNILDGGIGADIMLGGLGNDIYFIDNVDDHAYENFNAGVDTVKTTLDNYMLETDIEYLYLMGAAAITGAGNALNNVIFGNAENNILDGGLGADTLYGGLGNDEYHVNLIASTYRGVTSAIWEDSVVEYNAQGIDTLVVQSAALALTAPTTLTLSAYIENIDIIGTGTVALNLTGNNSNNSITGNGADNIINGGLGADDMSGWYGNDIYIFDNIGDTATEIGTAGFDIVRIQYANASKTTPIIIDMSLPAFDNIESVELLGAGLFNVIGNDLDNVIRANASINHLAGDMGNDTYYVDALDVITELDGYGTDSVMLNMAAGTYNLGANIENLTALGVGNLNLTGNSSNNNITGNNGANILDGGIGVDALAGGLGNDTYLIDADDTIIENLNAGIDHVKAGFNYTLFDNFEYLTLTGAGNFNGTGNALNNVIWGNGGDNILDGLAGADTMLGGLGNDTYTVDLYNYKNTARFMDVVTEYNAQGNDTLILRGELVINPTNVGLANYFENLDARDTGLTKLHLYGNNDANILHGNDWGNTLVGGLGNDILYGEGGADILYGGVGADHFMFQEPSWNATDTIADFKITENDKIDISDLLIDYDPGTSNLSDYVSFAGNMLSVDRDGAGTVYNSYEAVVSINATSGLTITNFIDHLITTT